MAGKCFVVLVMITGFGAFAAEGENTYRNRVVSGNWPDPGIIRVGQDYYSVCSSQGWQPGESIYLGDGWKDLRNRERGDPDLGWIGYEGRNKWTATTFGVFAVRDGGTESKSADFNYVRVNSVGRKTAWAEADPTYPTGFGLDDLNQRTRRNHARIKISRSSADVRCANDHSDV